MTNLENFSNPLLAPTGRVKSFLENPDRGTLPASCTLIRLAGNKSEDYQDLFEFVQTALVTAAGVNIHLSLFKPSHKGQGWIVGSPEEADRLITVQDSMKTDDLEDGVGIIEASSSLYYLLQRGLNVYIDTSRIRPEGAIGSKGQVASGPDSFMEIFKSVEDFSRRQTIISLLTVLSTFNKVIRRGGVYKNGAVTTSLPIWHPSFSEYAFANGPTDHPYLFKGAIIPKNWEDYLDSVSICMERVNVKDLWLEKVVSSEDNVTWLSTEEIDPDYGNTLGHNVCREILIQNKGTCIIMPINLGMAEKPSDLPLAFSEGMKLLCEFQEQDYQAQAGIYLSAKKDKQVGLGLMGLANLLALEYITYQNFTDTLSSLLTCLEIAGVNGKTKTLSSVNLFQILFGNSDPLSKASEWAYYLIRGFQAGEKMARHYGMERAFGIAPTASVSFRYKDRDGYTVCPEYSPPLGQQVERLSNSGAFEDNKIYRYPINVEIAAKVDKQIHFQLTVCLQKLMDMTGLGHSISFNVWDEMDYDFLVQFLESPLKSTYYLWETDQNYLDKSDQLGASCGVPIR
jgi:hypothetical protein